MGTYLTLTIMVLQLLLDTTFVQPVFVEMWKKSWPIFHKELTCLVRPASCKEKLQNDEKAILMRGLENKLSQKRKVRKTNFRIQYTNMLKTEEGKIRSLN